MLKALSAVSLDASMLRIPPWKNKWLIPAVALPSLMHLLTLYSPVIASAFGLAPLSMKEWKVSI
jgi:Ca2+-transporting ATPase